MSTIEAPGAAEKKIHQILDALKDVAAHKLDRLSVESGKVRKEYWAPEAWAERERSVVLARLHPYVHGQSRTRGTPWA
jgi:hypothetical protein